MNNLESSDSTNIKSEKKLKQGLVILLLAYIGVVPLVFIPLEIIGRILPFSEAMFFALILWILCTVFNLIGLIDTRYATQEMGKRSRLSVTNYVIGFVYWVLTPLTLFIWIIGSI